MEQWRKVPGYENYEISIETKEGKCRNIKRGKLLSTNPDKWEHRIYWDLYKNGVGKRWQAARWIALTYPELVENEWFEGAQIDHKDTDPTNNQPSNLHWVTQAGNNANPITTKHRSEGIKGKNKNHPSFSKQVAQYSIDGDLVKIYPSTKQAGRETGIRPENIANCCLKKTYTNKKGNTHQVKTAGGYVWKYVTK